MSPVHHMTDLSEACEKHVENATKIGPEKMNFRRDIDLFFCSFEGRLNVVCTFQGHGKLPISHCQFLDHNEIVPLVNQGENSSLCEY